MTRPWEADPFNPYDEPQPTHVLWDYSQQLVVGEGRPVGLFDTLWSYTYRPWRSALQWQVVKAPGTAIMLAEEDVPEMVRLAAMVAS